MTILEAGCGAGRFTEIMLQEGANVYAVDVSSAVEANYQNCRQYPSYSVCQADIMALPFMREQFDIIVCIGVIQHTPSPEDTISRLCSYLKPQGRLLIDHYSPEYYMNFSRKTLRTFLLKRDARFSMFFCKWLVTLLWPFHRISWKFRSLSLVHRIRAFILKNSPIVDYHDTYFEIEQKLLFQWALLDTHDTLTDFYKHFRTPEQIKQHLENCDMDSIEIWTGGNGVEGRARKKGKIKNISLTTATTKLAEEEMVH
jgi:SAM-dependent methyltransferase